MNIAIYCRGKEYLPLEALEKILLSAKSMGAKLSINSDAELQNPSEYNIQTYTQAKSIPEKTDFIISLGGDGTLLSCVAALEGKETPILGINSGRLGFLSSVGITHITEALECLQNGCYTLEERTMLAVEGGFSADIGYRHAFNEFTIQKNGLSMITVSLKINQEQVADYNADGLIISTPSGSTAYSMSVGGPILSPACDAFVITPIAPHNLTMRPLVVEGSSLLELHVSTRQGKCIATLDNRSCIIDDTAQFKLQKSNKKAVLVKLNNNTFYSTIRKKLMWGTKII